MTRTALSDIKWSEAFYGSGSVTITSNLKDMPHYRFGYPWAKGTEAQRDRMRYDAAHAVTAMLNGGPKIDGNGAMRMSDNRILLGNGIDIIASGPSYDASPDGSLNWKQRPGHKWDLRRKELIDYLWSLIPASN